MILDYLLLLEIAFLLASLISVVLIVLNRPVFRLFIKSAFGNRKRVVLIITGLMIGSAMISGALVMRSTMLTLSDNLVTLSYGHIDETVTLGGPLSGGFFSYQAFQEINSTLSGNANVSGAVPMIYTTVSAYDNTSGVPYSNIGFVASPWSSNGILGNFAASNGSSVSGLPAGEVLIDQLAAAQLNATAGDKITVFASNGHSFTGRVAAVVKDNYRGYFDSGYNIFTGLAFAQSLLGIGNSINLIAIANTGSILGSVSKTDAVMAVLVPAVDSANRALGLSLSAYPVLQDQLSTIRSQISDISDLYLALSLFAIAAGLILVVVIFYMLAEERMRDLGMLRAIGVTRQKIVGGFITEGFIYTLLSCFVGSFVGIGIGFLMVYGFILLFGGTFAAPIRETNILMGSFTVTPADIITGFAAGALATYAIITAASYRISRFSIVEALRRSAYGRLPSRSARKYVLPALLLLAALLSFYQGTDTRSLLFSMLSLSLLSISVLAFLYVFRPSEIFMGLMGIALIAQYGLPASWNIFPSNYTASYYVYVESGIFLVTGGLLVFFALLPFFLKVLKPRRNSHGTLVPTLRQAFATPAERKVRTALSLSLFSFVIFGIVSVSILGSMINTAAVRTVNDQSGGYNFVMYSANGGNMTSALEGDANITQSLAYASIIYDVGAGVTSSGNGFSAFVYPLIGLPLWDKAPFYSHNSYSFYSLSSAYASPAAAWYAVAHNSSLAIIDMTLAGVSPGNFAQGAQAPAKVGLGSTLTLYGQNHTSAKVTVIGILNEFGLQGIFVKEGSLQSLGLLSQAYPVIMVKVKPGVSASAVSIQARRDLVAYNPVVIDLALITEQLTMAINGVVEMTEIFIAMGLVAGTAGLGIIAMRSVVERYQQIGLLRALGFTRRMVSASFLLEFVFIALSGSLIGVLMSLLNGYIISQRLSSLLSFDYYPGTIAALVLISIGLTIAAVLSSVRAVSRIEPSSALRYIE